MIYFAFLSFLVFLSYYTCHVLVNIKNIMYIHWLQCEYILILQNFIFFLTLKILKNGEHVDASGSVLQWERVSLMQLWDYSSASIVKAIC